MAPLRRLCAARRRRVERRLARLHGASGLRAGAADAQAAALDALDVSLHRSRQALRRGDQPHPLPPPDAVCRRRRHGPAELHASVGGVGRPRGADDLRGGRDRRNAPPHAAHHGHIAGPLHSVRPAAPPRRQRRCLGGHSGRLLPPLLVYCAAAVRARGATAHAVGAVQGGLVPARQGAPRRVAHAPVRWLLVAAGRRLVRRRARASARRRIRGGRRLRRRRRHRRACQAAVRLCHRGRRHGSAAAARPRARPRGSREDGLCVARCRRRHRRVAAAARRVALFDRFAERRQPTGAPRGGEVGGGPTTRRAGRARAASVEWWRAAAADTRRRV
mmetsp:Transcript_33209/g.106584  ORF Transcript_33209/g.106584 Transcript_33209/m.106584 type:complete len:332 (-) Transcript_33209:210-1205(-)